MNRPKRNAGWMAVLAGFVSLYVSLVVEPILALMAGSCFAFAAVMWLSQVRWRTVARQFSQAVTVTAREHAYLVSAIALVVAIVVPLECNRRSRARRAETRRLIAAFEEPLAEIRRIQREHPSDAYDHALGELSDLYMAMIDLRNRSDELGLLEAAPMLRNVARGTQRDGAIERFVRLYALTALAKIQPEEASELVPWVGEVLKESVKDGYDVIQREPEENRRAAFRGRERVAFSALTAFRAMESHAAPAVPILQEIAARPELFFVPGEEYDLRIEASLTLARIREALSSATMSSAR